MVKQIEKKISKKDQDLIFRKCRTNQFLDELEINKATQMVKDLKEASMKSKRNAQNPPSYIQSNISPVGLSQLEYKKSEIQMSNISETLANHLQGCIEKSKRKGT